jgi:hypothetical protein
MEITQYTEDFADRGVDVAELEESYTSLINRCVDTIDTAVSSELGDPQRIQKFSLALRQSLLHRAVKLFESSVLSLNNDDVYTLALAIRGHYETTAALGFLHNRLHSMNDGNISPETVDTDIGTLMLGSRDKDLLEKVGEKAIEAKQVLNLLEYADKSVTKHIMGGKVNEHAMLTDTYEWLCEFCHPNYHSMSVAYRIDKQHRTFVYRHSERVVENEARIFEYIYISNPIFIELYDGIEKLLPE